MKNFFSIVFLIFIFSAVSFAQTERDKGIELYQQGEYEKAIEVLKKVVDAHKTDGDAWLYLGTAYARIGKSDEAIKAIRQCPTSRCRKSVSDDSDNYYDKELKIISKAFPQYTDEAKRLRVVGSINVVVDFGADGNKFIFPLERLPNGLTESAVNAARKIKYEPAVKNGSPVSVLRIIEYHFDLF